jgi:hypothetical protein
MSLKKAGESAGFAIFVVEKYGEKEKASNFLPVFEIRCLPLDILV